jgi:hypothetical protein
VLYFHGGFVPVTRLFKTKAFARFARREGLSDRSLREAVGAMERGLIHAELGSGVVKQRIARKGQGRSRGLRTIVVFRRASRAVFVYGYAKSDQATIGPRELAAFRILAVRLLAMTEPELDRAVESGALEEVR